jgi:5-methylcytosine-specific restriction endonuclease McrA
MDRRSQWEELFSKVIAEKGFDYVGGYENKYSKVRIRCRLCGYEFERTCDFLKRGNVICSECEKKKAAELQEAKEAKAEAKRITEEIFRLWYPPVDTRREALLDQTGICEICGKPYIVRGYVKSCGLKYARDNGVCSSECRDEKKRQIIRELHRGRKDSHRHRARKYGCEYDPSVKLEKLIARDGLRCAICGEMCDPNDHSWSKYSGPKYPSIDHIIPMSKGGGHTWDNVQVAHIICNSEKGDSFEGVSA